MEIMVFIRYKSNAGFLSFQLNPDFKIASWKIINKNPSFVDKLPKERGENAYMTHPANRRNGYRTRLVVYQGRAKTPDLMVLRKPCNS